MSVVGLSTKGVLAGGAAAVEPEPTTPDPCAGFPAQWWLIRDPLLEGAGAVTASSEYGPRTGFVVPDEDNGGTMLASALGDPDDDTAGAFDLRLVKGGRTATAEYAYRPDSEEWRGYSSDLYQWGHHCPLQTTHMDGAILIHSRVHRRILIASAGASTVAINYVDADDRPQSQNDWTQTTFTPVNGIHSSDVALAGCELADGTILLGVRRQILDSGSAEVEGQGDWDLYRSRDGGINWVLLFENVLQYLGYQANDMADKGCSRMAASGDWVRWMFVGDGTIIITAVSPDRGTSWSTIATLEAADVAALLTDQDFDVFPYDLTAVDEAGTFLLAANPNGANQANIWYANRGEAWQDSSILGTVGFLPGTPRTFLFLRDPYWIYLWVGGWDQGVEGGWTMWRVARDQAISGTWSGPYSDPIELRGAVRLMPTQARAAWCGDRMGVLYYLTDTAEASPYPREATRPVVFWMGGWSTRPAATDWVRNDGQFEGIHWAYPQGQPAGGATSATQSQWINTTTNGGTHTWGIFTMPFESYAAGDEAMQRITVPTTDGRFPPHWDCTAAEEKLSQQIRRFAAEWVMASGATGNATATNVALRLKMPSRVYSTGPAWELMIRIGPLQTVVYDEARGVPLATLTSVVGEDIYRRYRFAVSAAASPSDPYGILQYRREGGDVWHDTGRFALGQPYGASGITQFSAQFGHLGHTPATTMYSYWRELHIWNNRFRTDYAQSGGFDVDDLPGAIIAPRPRFFGCGSTGTDCHLLAAAWGGGGGAKGDTWSHALEHAGAGELALIDSPRTAWHSTVGATAVSTTLIYDAARGAAVDTGERFNHSHVALYGLENRTVLVDYADDSTFLSGVVAGATVRGEQYTGVRLSARAGRTVTLDPATDTGIRPGELAGRFLLVTAGTTAGAFNTLHKIDKHVFDGTNHLVTLATGGQFAAGVLSAGDTVTVISDRAWAAYGSTVSKRYMRLRFGATGGNNWDGRWRLGQLIAGIARQFDPPLDWSFTDEETPNAIVESSRGGQTWGYQEGPASRMIVARQIGDVTGARAEFRDLLRTIGGYVEQPMALLLNAEGDEDQDRALLLARFEGTTNLDNQAWARDADQVERPAGDILLQFREIV